MSLHTWIEEDSLRGWILRPIFEAGYVALRAVVQALFRPLFRVHRVGPRLRIPDGPIIFCANHASYLDPAFLQLVLPRRVVFVMTNTFYARPAGRWFFRLVGAIPVGTGRLARDGLHRSVELLRRGRAVAIFPEGRLSTDGEPGRPQRGVAIMARMGRATVVPVGIVGNFEVWPRGARWLRLGNVRLAYGRPLPPPPPTPHTREAEIAFAEEVMERIREARARARSGGCRRFQGSSRIGR